MYGFPNGLGYLCLSGPGEWVFKSFTCTQAEKTKKHKNLYNIAGKEHSGKHYPVPT